MILSGLVTCLSQCKEKFQFQLHLLTIGSISIVSFPTGMKYSYYFSRVLYLYSERNAYKTPDQIIARAYST